MTHRPVHGVLDDQDRHRRRADTRHRSDCSVMVRGFDRYFTCVDRLPRLYGRTGEALEQRTADDRLLLSGCEARE